MDKIKRRAIEIPVLLERLQNERRSYITPLIFKAYLDESGFDLEIEMEGEDLSEKDNNNNA